MSWDGYWTLDDTEIINVERTEAYVGENTWFTPLFKNDALHLVVGDSAYTDPVADNAPWYDSNVAASAEFYGVYPLEIIGIDDSTRAGVVTESTREGGTITALRRATKSIVVSAMLIAASEQGAEYGRQWLTRALAGPCGSSGGCDGQTLAFLASEPTIGDSVAPGACSGRVSPRPDDPFAVTQLLARSLRRVSLTAPLLTTAKRNLSDGSAAWNVGFTVTAGNPFEFGFEQPFLENWIGPNPFSNPNFDVDTTGWSTAATFFTNTGATLTRITSDYSTLPAAGQVVTTAASNQQGVSTDITVPAATTVVISARVAPISGRPVLLRARDTTNSVSGSTGTSGLAGSGWQTITTTITTGALAATVKVSLSTDTTAAISTFIVDAMDYVEEIPWPDGTPPAGASVSRYTKLAEAACLPTVFTPLYDPLCVGVVAPPNPPGIAWGCYTAPDFWIRRTIVIPASSVPGWTDAVILATITPGVDEEIRNVRFRFYEDPLATGVVPADECSFVGDFVITYIPEGSELTMDGIDESVYVDSAEGVRRRADNLVYGSDGSFFTWPALSCGQGYVVVVDIDSTSSQPYVDLTLVERLG